MKKLICLLTILSVSSLHNLTAGDYCSPKGITYDDCTTCENTGYLFAYGGVSFGYDLDLALNGGGNASAELDTGYILGAGVGLESDFLCGSRFELEFVQIGHELGYIGDNGNNVMMAAGNPVGSIDIESRAVLVNVLKTFSVGGLDAYAGGGFGVADLGVDIFDVSTFAYQFKAGVDLPVADCLSLFAEYKLLGFTSTDALAGLIDIDGFMTHNIVLGARVAF